MVYTQIYNNSSGPKWWECGSLCDSASSIQISRLSDNVYFMVHSEIEIKR